VDNEHARVHHAAARADNAVVGEHNDAAVEDNETARVDNGSHPRAARNDPRNIAPERGGAVFIAPVTRAGRPDFARACGPVVQSRPRRADEPGVSMLEPAPPMSNAERQRRFRASHPGYFKKYRRSMRQLQADAERVAAAAAVPLVDPAKVSGAAPKPQQQTLSLPMELSLAALAA
jgi:hypothetical protein